MDDPADVGDDQITSTTTDSPQDIRPGGDPFMSSDSQETIDVSFVNELYDAAEVTELTISRGVEGDDTGVEAVQIWYKPEDSEVFLPYAPSDSAATLPDTITVTDDSPIVLTDIDDTRLTDIRIQVIKDDASDIMTFDIKVHACLHPGESLV